MSPQLNSLIKKARELSLREQIVLIATISNSLHNNFTLISTAQDFWNPKSIEQLIDNEKIQAVNNLSDLAADFWPEEESIDEFVEYIYGQRREDRLKE